MSRDELEHTPGALRTNSMDLVTQYVPGSYMIHDQLHIRGGHQVSWLVDGVPVPNTNIASNVGPQFDPKDIETIDIQRGGYSADFGDRAYGVFNVLPRSGFERNREAEAVVSYGNLHETNDQFSVGDHSDRLAYYVSGNVNTSDVGLEPPTSETLHDRTVGVGAFGSLIFQSTPTDQIRLVSSLRGDRYEVPNTPDDQAAGIDDIERERDGFVNLSWMHTVGSKAFLTRVAVLPLQSRGVRRRIGGSDRHDHSPHVQLRRWPGRPGCLERVAQRPRRRLRILPTRLAAVRAAVGRRMASN